MSLLTLHVGISDVNAISPFDQFIPPKPNETSNQSSQDHFEKDLPGEHGYSQDED